MKYVFAGAFATVCIAVVAFAQSVRASSPTPTSHPVLIIGYPTSIAITYYLPPPMSAAPNSPPTGVKVIRNRATVETLARLANNLNSTSGGSVSCPLGENAHARLVFSYRNGDRWTILAHLDGCAQASAHGARGWIMGSQKDHPQAFFRLLDRLVGFHRS